MTSTEIIEALAYEIIKAISYKKEAVIMNPDVYDEAGWRNSKEARGLAREIAEEVMVRLDDAAGITLKASNTKLTKFIDNLITVPAHAAYNLEKEAEVKETADEDEKQIS